LIEERKMFFIKNVMEPGFMLWEAVFTFESYLVKYAF
jgi:hypothetical protein